MTEDKEIEKNLKDLDDICDECKEQHESVTQNLILTGFKICKSWLLINVLPLVANSDLILLLNLFHINLVKNSGAEPIPINPRICFLKYLKRLRLIHDPMLDPTKIKLFFLTIFFIPVFASFVHLLILPSVKLPDDFP